MSTRISTYLYIAMPVLILVCSPAASPKNLKVLLPAYCDSPNKGTTDILLGKENQPRLLQYPTCYWTKETIGTSQTIPDKAKIPQIDVPQEYRRLIVFFPNGEVMGTTWGIAHNASQEQLSRKLSDEVSALRDQRLKPSYLPGLVILVGKYRVKKTRVSFDLDCSEDIKKERNSYLNVSGILLERWNIQKYGRFFGTVNANGLSVIEDGQPRFYQCYSDDQRQPKLQN